MSATETLLLLGGTSRTAACLEALLAAGEPVRALALDRDAPDLAARALAHGLTVFDARRPGDPAVRDRLATIHATRWIMAGYGRILPPETLALAPARTPTSMSVSGGVLNLHGGRLPMYRGASVLNWQIIQGESSIGLSVLWTDAGVDTGPVLAQETFPLGPDEDFAVAQSRADARFPPLLLGVLTALRHNRARAVPQDPSLGRCWPKRRPQDGAIAWESHTARQVHDLVRALARPCPGAFTHRIPEGAADKVCVWRTRVASEDTADDTPGVVLGLTADGVAVAAARGVVVLTEHACTGRPLAPGDRFSPR